MCLLCQKQTVVTLVDELKIAPASVECLFFPLGQPVFFITVRKRSCRKVASLHLSVILFTGAVYTPRQTPPWADTPQGRPPRADTRLPSPLRRPLQRTVRILLEYILVFMYTFIGKIRQMIDFRFSFPEILDPLLTNSFWLSVQQRLLK